MAKLVWVKEEVEVKILSLVLGGSVDSQIIAEEASLFRRLMIFSGNFSEAKILSKTSSMMTSWMQDLVDLDRKGNQMVIELGTRLVWEVSIEDFSTMMISVLVVLEEVQVCSSKCKWVVEWVEVVSLLSRHLHFLQDSHPSQSSKRPTLRMANAWPGPRRRLSTTRVRRLPRSRSQLMMGAATRPKIPTCWLEEGLMVNSARCSGALAKGHLERSEEFWKALWRGRN